MRDPQEVGTHVCLPMWTQHNNRIEIKTCQVLSEAARTPTAAFPNHTQQRARFGVDYRRKPNGVDGVPELQQRCVQTW